MADLVESSSVRKWIDRIVGQSEDMIGSSRTEEVALTLRQYGEGGMVGAILGAIDSELKDGLDIRGIPIDFAVSVGGAVGAIWKSDEEYSHDLRNLGSHSFTIFAFRSTKKLLKRKGDTAGLEDDETSTHSGDDDVDVGEEDPIVEAARSL